jgi:hypothetical protein
VTRAASWYTLMACFVVSLLALGAHAAPSTTRVLLDGSHGDPVYLRIESELKLLDIPVDRASRAASAPSPRSESSPGEPAAVVSVDATRVSIRLARRYGGDELSVQRRPGERPGLVALAAVELLRARIVHPREAAGSTQPSDASTPGRTSGPPSVSSDEHVPSHAAAAPDSRSGHGPWGLFVGPGMAASAGGTPPTMVLQVAADWRSPVDLYVGVRLLPGLTEASWEVEAGACTQRIGLASLAGGYSFRFARDQWTLALGAGGGVLRSSFGTVPDAANKASEALSGVDWSGTAHVETSLAWHPVAHLGLGLSGLVGAATSRIILPNRARALPESSNADQTGASFGRPLVVLSLGLEARF